MGPSAGRGPLKATIFNCEVGRRLHLATFQKEVLT